MQVLFNVFVLCGDCQIRATQCCGATEGETWSVARLVHLEIPVGSGAVMSSHDAPLKVKALGGRPDPVMRALYKSRGAHGFVYVQERQNAIISSRQTLLKNKHLRETISHLSGKLCIYIYMYYTYTCAHASMYVSILVCRKCAVAAGCGRPLVHSVRISTPYNKKTLHL